MSQMSVMRLSTVALIVCLAGLTAAAPWATCPNDATTDTYAPATTASCTPYQTCVSSFCSCQGAVSANATSHYCIWGASTPRPNCTQATACNRALIACINEASKTSECSSELMALRMALMGIANGAVYSGSTTEKACQKHTCMQFNQSVTSPTCTNISYSEVCVAPYVYTGILELSGNWVAVLNNATAKALLILALQADMTREFGFTTVVISVTLTANGGLRVEFVVSVSPLNPAFQSALANAQSSASWLNATTTTYSQSGGTGSITVQGITQVTTAAPTTAPGTSSPTPTPAGGSVASVRSVFAVALAVVVAIVFAA